MRCVNCNSEVADGMRFCPNCGNPMISRQQPMQGQCQQPQQSQCHQPQYGHYQQPLQGQCQQPQYGQYQQPLYGQCQQPQFGPYQQPMQGQYQQPQYGQNQQSYQGHYHQQYVQHQPQLPQRPQLTFGEAINIASQRILEFEGRSRRSEFWWWFLAVSLGGAILSLIPYLRAFSPLIIFFLLFSIVLRRLNDVLAPMWFGITFLCIWAANAILSLIYTLGIVYRVGFIKGLVRAFGKSNYQLLMIGFGIMMLIAFIGFIYFGVKDSNPRINPDHGPSPKYSS